MFQEASLSTDVVDGDRDPTPHLDDPDYNHGTRCAGVIASVANNSFCSVGIAYNCKIAGNKALSTSSNHIQKLLLATSKVRVCQFYPFSQSHIEFTALFQAASEWEFSLQFHCEHNSVKFHFPSLSILCLYLYSYQECEN